VRGEVEVDLDKKRVGAFAQQNVQNVVLKATIRYYRQWLSFDGVWLEFVKHNRLNETAFTSIVREYGVARCLPAKNATRAGVVKELNDIGCSWPSSLLKRHASCEKLADSKKGLFIIPKRQDGSDGEERFAGSLVTKLMWFIRPDGWTVFDGFAANGLACTRPDSREKMKQFYAKLENAKFNELALEMQSKIANTSFREMHAARIIDLALMIKGGYLKDEDIAKTNCCFQSLLPQRLADELIALSNALNENYGQDDLFQT
jgi:hypothetical protein